MRSKGNQLQDFWRWFCLFCPFLWLFRSSSYWVLRLQDYLNAS